MATYQPVQGISTRDMTPTLYPPSVEDHNRLTNSTTSFEPKTPGEGRLSRTPSPTPSELKALATGAVNWKGLLSPKHWFKKEWACTSSSSSSFEVMLKSYCMDTVYYVILIVILVITSLTIIYHTQIVNWLTPATRWLHGYVYFIHGRRLIDT